MPGHSIPHVSRSKCHLAVVLIAQPILQSCKRRDQSGLGGGKDQDSCSGSSGNMVYVIGVAFALHIPKMVLGFLTGLAPRWDFMVVNNQEARTHHSSKGRTRCTLHTGGSPGMCWRDTDERWRAGVEADNNY